MRRVPVATALREILVAELLRTGRRGDQLVFGRTAGTPFSPTRLTARADKAWKDADLERITLHECRHTFASMAIAAGVNAKALSSYMGRREHPDHVRPLWAPDAGQRGRSGRAARRVPSRGGRKVK